MNVYELVEKVGGEIVRGKARVRVGRDYVVIGTLNGDHMMFTAEGTEMAREHESAPKKGGRKAKAALEPEEVVVELEEAPVVKATADAELADLLAAVEDK